MGEDVPGGAKTARVLSSEAARAALVEAGATRDLDVTLARSAEIVLQRFGASMAMIYVARHGHRIFWAPLSGPHSRASIFAAPETFESQLFMERLVNERSGLIADLAEIEARDAGQEAAFTRGMRSSIFAALRDERESSLGFVLVASATPRSFDGADLAELERFGAALAWFVRPGILLEEQESERRLLKDEANLLAAMAEADSEQDLVAKVADGVRSALGADLALLMVDSPLGAPPWLLSSPADALGEDLWAEARTALNSGGNRSMTERSRAAGGAFTADLSASPETPIEIFLRDSLGMLSLVSSNRSHHWGGLGLGVAAMRRQRGSWTEAQRTFLARLARLLEISIERIRRGDLAVGHAVQLERQTDLLATGADLVEALSSSDDVESACTLISERLREFFHADHVVFGAIDIERRKRSILGFSSNVMEASEFSERLADSDQAAYSTLAGPPESAECLSDLRETRALNEASKGLLGRGLRSLIRAPFRLSDGSLGIVAIASREAGLYSPQDSERLLDLCRPVGVAIDRVRLLSERASTNAMLDTKTRVLAALVPGATIHSAGQVFVSETCRLLGATHAVAAVFSSTGVTIAGLAGDVLEREPTERFLASGEPDAHWRRVLTEGTPQLVADLATIDRTPAEDHLLASGLGTIMRAPIVDSGGQLRGLVTAGAPKACTWDEGDLATFFELSRSLGLVFERAQLFEAVEERTSKVQALTRLLSTLSLQAPPGEVAQQFSAQVRE